MGYASWNSWTDYAIGDIAEYAGVIYQAVNANLNDPPPSANWTLLPIAGPAGPTGPTGPAGTGSTGPTGAQGPTGPAGTTPPTETYITANSINSQVVGNTPTVLYHDQIPLSNNIFPIGLAPPPYAFLGFQVTETGTYKWSSCVQFFGASGKCEIAIWAVVNGNPVADSATYTTINNNDVGVIFVELILGMNTGDVFEWWAVNKTGTSVNVEVYPATGGVPVAPGIITNAYRLR